MPNGMRIPQQHIRTPRGVTRAAVRVMRSRVGEVTTSVQFLGSCLIIWNALKVDHRCDGRGTPTTSARVSHRGFDEVVAQTVLTDAERPLQLGDGGASCGPSENGPLVCPRADQVVHPKVNRRHTRRWTGGSTGVEPDSAALPVGGTRLPWSPRPVVSHRDDPPVSRRVDPRGLPLGPGAPCGVVEKFYAPAARPRKAFLEESSELFSPTGSST